MVTVNNQRSTLTRLAMGGLHFTTTARRREGDLPVDA
jgi:hypothetical protein